MVVGAFGQLGTVSTSIVVIVSGYLGFSPMWRGRQASQRQPSELSPVEGAAQFAF